jgi:hypothetical protein
MSIAGPNFPATVTDDSSVGTVSWTNVTRVVSTNSSYATASVTNTVTHYINCQNFGFSVPSNATIAGVLCSVIAHTNGSLGDAGDNSVKLIKGGTIQGTDQVIFGTLAALASSTDLTFLYPVTGGGANLWGLTLTPADVNASNFGVAVSLQGETNNTNTIFVDSITLQVFYYFNATTAKFPGTAADVAPGSDTAWASVNNIKATDTSVATCTLANSATSDYLEATNFGFAVPSNATINGVLATWTKDGEDKDTLMSLIKNGTISGNNYSYINGLQFQGYVLSTLTAVSYGSANDLWGLTLTPADVNASNFGCMCQCTDNDFGGKGSTANVDSVTMVVYYTLPAASNVLYDCGTSAQLIYNGNLLTLAF